MSRVHIVGAGIAGLAAAVRLAKAGVAVSLYEAAPRAGGRARSYHDPHLGCVIDNGNHLVLSGNEAVMAYMDEIGARGRLAGPATADFPFVDAVSRKRWTLRPGMGRVPWWLLDPSRRVPDTSVWDYLSIARVLRAGANETMADCLGRSALYRGFWEPLTVAVLNTAPEEASAQLMAPVLRETFLKGGAACRPLVVRTSLADAFVDPAIAALNAAGADVRFGARLRALSCGDRVTALDLDGASVAIGADDVVILAVPAWIAQPLLPWLATPDAGEPIVNVHYRLPARLCAEGEARIVGVVGGLAQWVFARDDLASVTISAARAVVDAEAEDIATRCWPDVALALGLNDMREPPSRVVKERRATFAQTPASIGKRPEAATPVANLLLAGDWTATGLPATLEGSVRSGFTAAAQALARLRNGWTAAA